MARKRLQTRVRVSRFIPNALLICVFCQVEDEDQGHLFISYCFAIRDLNPEENASTNCIVSWLSQLPAEDSDHMASLRKTLLICCKYGMKEIT